MDTQKDIQKDTQIPSNIYLSKKTEKIVSAVYLVTNLFKDTEPLKNVIRNQALYLIDVLWNTTVSTSTSTLISKYAELSSLLSVAKTVGFISEMNHSILEHEIKEITAFLDSSKQLEMNSLSLFDNHYFSVGSPFQQHAPFKKELAETLHKPVKDIKDTSDKRQVNVLYNKDIKFSRKDKIINLLKTTDNLSIKDFSEKINDCSEKTIQRELISLIEEGKIIKKGERRWSTYSIKS